MKAGSIIFSVTVTIALVIHSVIWANCWWGVHVNMQYLKLADDASSPQAKYEYLSKFVETMRDLKLPAHAAFYLAHERNKLDNQFTVLESLKARCKELIGVDPSSMGYATGIQQITGQEFEHVLLSVYGVFTRAQWTRYGAFCYYGGWLWLILVILGWFIVAVL